MIGALLGLIPLFGWGGGDYISSRLSKKYHPVYVNLAFSAVGPIVGLPICILYGFPEISIKSTLLFWAVSAVITVGFVFMVKAFSRGATGVVSPLANSYVIVTTIVSVMFLDIVLSMTDVLAVAIIVGGIVLLTYKKDPQHNHADFIFAVRYATVALFAFGLGFVLFDVASTQNWYQNNFYFQTVGFLNALLLFVLWPIKSKYQKCRISLRDPLIFLGGFVGTIGTIGFFSALALAESVVIPAALAAASPLATVTFAYVFDKEHLSRLQRTATIVIVLGIILLTVA